MTEDASLVGDSSAHGAQEPAPGGGFYRHRLTIRFTNGEMLVYTVREALHAEDISAEHRFVVIHSYLYERPELCAEIILLNLNEITYIKTEHITEEELRREELRQHEAESEGLLVHPQPHLSHIGFI